MTILQAIILGIVEGITEYLPVSSTGHLIITQYFLGLPESDAMKAFSVCIQGGAIIAVAGLYFSRVKQMCLGLLGKDAAGLKLVINLLIAFCPAVIIGLTLGGFIKDLLFNATTVATTWILGGIVILLFTGWRKRKGLDDQGVDLEDLSPKQALGVGLLQCVAMCPGVSRSLSTMLGGLMVGLSLKAAIEFSFLLGLITLSAATVWDAMKHGEVMVQEIGVQGIVVGTIASWLSAVVAVRWLVSYLQKHSLNIFGWYRIAAGIFMFALFFSGAQLMASDEEPAAPTTQEMSK